ncbi:unnamed protein product, partial [Medioppia subpectinata]
METLFVSILSIEISGECLQTLLRFQDSFRSQKEWPFRLLTNLCFCPAVLDSSARFPFSGLLDGTIADFGEFDECLAISHAQNEFSVSGKYCLLNVLFPKPGNTSETELRFHSALIDVTNTTLDDTLFARFARNANLFYISRGLTLGACFPSTCSARDLQTLVSSLIEPTIGLKVEVNSCQSRDLRPPITTAQMVAIAVLSSLCTLTFAATMADFWGKENTFIICFSISRNWRKLFEKNTKTRALSAVHGMRVLAILWILVGHVYLMQFFHIFHVMRRLVAEMPRLAHIQYQPLKMGSFLQVDTFLFLGGVTAAYVTLDVTSRTKRRFDWFAFLALRWLRYTPAVCGLVLFYLLLPLLGSGPIFQQQIQQMYIPCEQYFYRNLLYYNNFFDSDGNCATHTWYLAVDFQLYALSPLLIFALKSRPKLGVAFALLLILVVGPLSAVSPLFLDSTLFPNLFSLNSILSEQSISRHFRLLYWGAWQHISPYCCGLVVGFVVHSRPTLRVSRAAQLCLWCLT